MHHNATNGSGGWFAVSRLIFDHHIVGAGQPVKPADPSRGAYSRMEAWLWIVAQAAHAPHRVMNRGDEVLINPGQLIAGRAELARVWNWTEKTVRGFVEKLEMMAMITLYCEQQKGQRIPNKRNVLTVSNYAQYQVSRDYDAERYGPPEGPPKGHQRASKRASNGSKKGHQNSGANPRGSGDFGDSHDRQGPPKGQQSEMRLAEKGPSNNKSTTVDTPPAPSRGKRGKFSAEQIELSEDGFDMYNRAAEQLGFSKCEARTPERRTRLLKRLDAIGGIDNFRRALWAVRLDPFLSGKSTKHSDRPFRLSFDVLMQTAGNMGDVLARLIDADGDRSAKSQGDGGGAKLISDIEAMTDDEQEELVRQHANGRWPFDKLGSPPGAATCAIRPDVLKRCGIRRDTYNAAGILQSGALQ